MKTIIQDVSAMTPAVIQQLRGALPAGFPAQIADSILDGIQYAGGANDSGVIRLSKSWWCGELNTYGADEGGLIGTAASSDLTASCCFSRRLHFGVVDFGNHWLTVRDESTLTAW